MPGADTAAAEANAVPRSIGRVLDLLEIVLAEPRNLTDSAAAAGLTPTTALRHLRALEARGYVTRDESNVYATGPTVRRIAATLRDGGDLDHIIAAVQPQLNALSNATGESTYLAVGDDRVASYVAAAQSDRAIRHVAWIGQTVPLDGTAVGEAIRDPGTAVARSGAVEADITAVSIGLPPVGSVSFAISIVGPTHRFDEQRQAAHATALRQAAREIATKLGIDTERTS